MSDVAPDLLAHSVTADYGPITAMDLDEPIECVRLVAHFGVGASHRETFMDPKGLPGLIADLQAIHDHVGAGG